MPEGDTIFRAARHLRRALVGQEVVRFEAPSLGARGQALLGRRAHDVESRGKNLLFHFEGDLVLYTHMKMTGSWHLYLHDEPWRKSARGLVARIDTPDRVAVCFNAPVVELMSSARALRHPTLSSLGPDLLALEPDLEEMRRRLRALEGVPLGEALLDQRAVAGIGNVYKSEVCFLLGLNPFAPVGRLTDEALDRLLRESRRLMLENLDTFRRTTRHAGAREPGGRLWVYGRRGARCHRCGGLVSVRRQGDAGRTTYFCARCQRVGAEGRGHRTREVGG